MITPSLPSGWIGTNPLTGIRDVTMGNEPISNIDFGLFHGAAYQGTVFDDNGAGSGTANNGVQDGTEAGVPQITVTASQGGTVIVNAVTAGNGSYTIDVPASVTGTVSIQPVLGAGNVATGGSAGTSGGTYTRPAITVTPTSGTIFTGLDFGAVPVNTLSPDGALTGAPGTTLYFPHTFLAESAGALTLATAQTPAPVIPGWTETLYQDTACSGQMATGDPEITSAIQVVAGQKVCVLIREFIPAGAPVNAQNQVKLTATLVYANATPGLTGSLTNTDTTTVNASGTMALTKQVQDLSQGTVSGTSDQALPGDVLEYHLTLSNQGKTAANSVSIADTTPAFTLFQSASCPLASALPSGITGCSVTTQPAIGAQGALVWTFTGSLAPATAVSVTYQVQVSP